MGGFQHFAASTPVGARATVVEFFDPKLSGPILMQELAQELSNLLDQLDEKHVVLDLSRVEFISSAALNRLIHFQKRVYKAGGSVKLCSLRPEIESVFFATRLNQVFDIQKDVSAALASY